MPFAILKQIHDFQDMEHGLDDANREKLFLLVFAASWNCLCQKSTNVSLSTLSPCAERNKLKQVWAVSVQ